MQPSLSPEKKTKDSLFDKAEEQIRVLHGETHSFVVKRYSPFSDIDLLGSETLERDIVRKRYFSGKLDFGIESKNFNLRAFEKSRLIYEEEKNKHKYFETRFKSVVDLVAFDDVGLRLFYESGCVSLASLHAKYKSVNISFTENDLLALLRQLVTSSYEFAHHSCYYNNYSNLSGLVFAKATASQQYKIKHALLDKASNNPESYKNDQVLFGVQREDSPRQTSAPHKLQESLYQVKTEQQKKDPAFPPIDLSLQQQINGIHSQQKSPFRIKSEQPRNEVALLPKIQSFHPSPPEKQGKLETKDSSTIFLQPIQPQEKSMAQSVLHGKQQNILVFEIMQICSLIYIIFMEQNYGDIEVVDAQNIEFLKDYPKLNGYLTSFIKMSGNNFEELNKIIEKLKKDRTFPENVTIESTLIEQIRQEEVEKIGEITHSYPKKLRKIAIPDEFKSISMIATQTINKQLTKELTHLKQMRADSKISPEQQDYYEAQLDFQRLSLFSQSSLVLVSEMIDELLMRVDETLNPFFFAEQILNKALIHFKMKTEGMNCIQQARNSNEIIKIIQGNEENELCGKSYLLMSEIVLREKNNRTRALELAMKSYEIRKLVHGSQSRTMEFVDSLRQISYLSQLLGLTEDSYLYLERAYIIARELKYESHRTVIELLAELALMTFHQQKYNQCIEKCSKMLEVYLVCAQHTVNFCFPFAMNLYAYSLLKLDPKTNLGLGLKMSIKAAKLFAQMRGDESYSQSILQNLLHIQLQFYEQLQSPNKNKDKPKEGHTFVQGDVLQQIPKRISPLHLSHNSYKKHDRPIFNKSNEYVANKKSELFDPSQYYT